MIEKIKALIRENGTCVMATVFNDKPHCSLMSYATDDECHEIYMITRRETKKYRNLLQNPSVSLLIDTRAESAAGRHTGVAMALTINGVFEKISDTAKRELALTQLQERHPELRAFIDNSGAELIVVRCLSFQLLECLQNSYFVNTE